MPIYEYTGPVPSEPIDYVMPHPFGGRTLTYTQFMDRFHDMQVPGRVFGARYRIMDIPGILANGEDAKSHVMPDVLGGEHVEAAENPDPALFTEVGATATQTGPPAPPPEGTPVPSAPATTEGNA